MKQLLTIVSLLVVLTAHSQTRVTKDAQGNYIVARRDSTAGSKPTGHTITDKDGNVHPVFISARGKLFYMKTSRNGNVYKVYIKE